MRLGSFLVELLALTALLAAGCRVLAGWLRVRLRPRLLVTTAVVALLVTAPYLAGRAFLVPNHMLAEQIPGTEEREATPFDDQSDVVFQLLPWELEVRRAFRDLRVPFWSDLLEGGSSLWSNPQAQVVSPIALLARLVPFEHFLLAALVFKMVVAFLGAWTLAAVLGMRRPARSIAALSFMLGGGVVAWSLFPLSTTVAWLPWLAAAAVRCARRPGLRGLALAGAVTALVLVSGHPEVALLGGVFAGGQALAFRSRRSGWMRPFARLTAAAALGFCFSAPVVVPFLLRVPSAQRAGENVHLARIGPPRSLLAAEGWLPPATQSYLVAPFGPEVFGRPYHHDFSGPMIWPDPLAAYAGVAALAGFGLLIGDPRARRRYGALFAIALLLVLAAAEFWPLAVVLHGLPLFGSFTASRGLAVVALILALLGAAGWERVLRRTRPLDLALVGGGLLVAAVSLAGAASAWAASLWLGIGVAVVLARGHKRAARAVLTALLLSDLVLWARWNLPRGKPELFYPPTPFMRRLTALDAEGGPWRATAMQRNLHPSLLPVFGIAEVRTHNPLAPATYVRLLRAAFGYDPSTSAYFGTMYDVGHPFLDFLNVRHVVLSEFHPVPSGLTVLADTRRDLHRVALNPSALPRWFFATGVEHVPASSLDAWIAGMTDARVVSVEDRSALAWLAALSFDPEPSDELSWVAIRPGRQKLRVRTTQPRLVATSLLDPRGWRVRSSEGNIERVIVHGAFLGFRAPPGECEIELLYRPPGFFLGVLLATVAGLVVGVGLTGGAWLSPIGFRGTVKRKRTLPVAYP